MKQVSNKQSLSTVDKFNKNYPKILRFIREFSLVSFAMIKTLLTTVGIPVILMLLAVVEVNRVQHGIAVIEENAWFASYGAWVIVLFNLIIEFMVHNNSVKKTRTKRSLRLLKKELMYRFGIGKEWKTEELEQGNIFLKMRGLITFALVVLALTGSMRDEIVAQGDTSWYEAMVNIVTLSSLESMMTWVSGLLFTITAVFGAQAIAKYIAIQSSVAEKDMLIQSERISNKERGIKIVSATVYTSKFKALRDLTNITDYDRVQITPELKFFDSVEKSWSAVYKSQGGFFGMLNKVNGKRE